MISAFFSGVSAGALAASSPGELAPLLLLAGCHRRGAICLLLAAGLAVAAWILIRRPADRWGYFAYPLGLLGWLGLTGRDRAVAGRLPAPGRLTWLAPAMARLTSAMAGLLASPGTNGTATALAFGPLA